MTTSRNSKEKRKMRYARRRCSGQELIKKWLARREITTLRERQRGKSHTTHITLGPLGAKTLISCLRNKIIQQKSRIVNMKTRNYSNPGFSSKMFPDLLMEEISYMRVRIWKISDQIWMWFSSFVFLSTHTKKKGYTKFRGYIKFRRTRVQEDLLS